MENNIPIASDELVTALGNRIPTDSDELTHWGIKGMKWGVRRYQNADGSLTPAGEKRRDKLERKLKKLGGDGEPSSGKGKSKAPEADVPRKKKASEMDDNELARALTRARMEDEYRQRRPEQTTEKKPSLIKKFRDEALVPAAVNAGKKIAEDAMKQMGEKLLKGKVDPNSLEALKSTFDKLDLQQKIDKIKNPDKYLSEEDRTKRQNREFDAEDREAKKRGYKDVYEEAKEKKAKAEEEASRKAAADKAASEANEAASREYYERGHAYEQATARGERYSTRPDIPNSYALAIYNKPVTSLTNSNYTNRGKSIVDDYMDNNYYDLIDRNGDVIRSWRDDD